MTETIIAGRGIVTSPHHLASAAGLSVLRDGGNALEAAVAMASTLAVVYPHMTSIGGDSFWLVSEPSGEIYGIDACGAAARTASPGLYHSQGYASVPWRGPLAANTVAGTLSGWQMALESGGGELSLSRLFRDAIWHAENGVPVTAGGADVAAKKDPELRDVPGYSDVFRPSGRPLVEGVLLRQPALAATLKKLAQNGLRDAYEGQLAASIAADLGRVGSPVSFEDLRTHQAKRCKPLSVHVREAQLYNMPPPTQGATSLLILALFDRLEAGESDSFDHVHGIVEATKLAFRNARRTLLGDPAFMTQSPQALLSSPEALDRLADEIDPAVARLWPEQTQDGDTTWFGAIDHEGRVVSAIQSTYFEFGSGIVLPETGIIWQNRGAGFTLQSDGWNALRPGRKPFHTLNPAIAKFNDGRVMAYGTMGGEGQPQTQAAIFSRYARFGNSLGEAIAAPRWLLGRTWGEESVTLKLEDRFDPSLYAQLRDAGHDLECLAPYTSTMGHAGALVRHESGQLEGAGDPRSDGGVAAW